jgi:hypothetical protein
MLAKGLFELAEDLRSLNSQQKISSFFYLYPLCYQDLTSFRLRGIIFNCLLSFGLTLLGAFFSLYVYKARRLF